MKNKIFIITPSGTDCMIEAIAANKQKALDKAKKACPWITDIEEAGGKIYIDEVENE